VVYISYVCGEKRGYDEVKVAISQSVSSLPEH
jgi:hypothetical protein